METLGTLQGPKASCPRLYVIIQTLGSPCIHNYAGSLNDLTVHELHSDRPIWNKVFSCFSVWTVLVWVPSCFSCVWLFVTPWTVACQAPLSRGFSRQECWSGLLCSPPGDLSHPGIKLASLMSPELAGRFFTTRAAWGAWIVFTMF